MSDRLAPALVPFLVGTGVYNLHVQNMAGALCEAGALHTYATSGVDDFENTLLRGARRAIRTALPGLDANLRRRAITTVPIELVRSRWRWELVRAAASRWGWDQRIVDWLWQQGEHDLDRACAKLVARQEIGGFLGVEYGALASLTVAKQLGKPAIVAFLSPHHRTLARWVDPEFERFPELVNPGQDYFDARDASRNDRRDQEATIADWIVTNSTFTTRSMVEAGFRQDRMITVPLGGPTPISENALPGRRPRSLRFAYVGPVSVRKGAHYLLQAWQQVAGPGMELHFYGAMLLPDRVRRDAESARGGSSITFHGSVSPEDLSRAYLGSSVLVLPTLCDGFGMVVSEALAHGLPVITTANAGAADSIVHGTNGFIVKPADAEDLSRTMMWCVEHPDVLFDMRRAALASAAGWTWTDFRQRFISLLGNALATPPSMTAERFPSTRRTRPAPVPGRICIVTPGYISQTPRVVREADALADAGYDVRVAFTQGQLETVRQFDRELLLKRPWRTSVFGWSDSRSEERWAHHLTRVRHRVMRSLPAGAWKIPGIVERAEGRVYPELADLAATERADLYIGHYPPGLAAACHAAALYGSAVAYDVEDLYPDAFVITPESEKIKQRILRLESEYVPRCSYVSAVSGPVASAFAARHRREAPVVVHNCHSWSSRGELDGRVLQRKGRELSLYWFSQTVGLDRGLQDVIRAAGRLGSRVQIHLQGAITEDVKRALLELATASGVLSSLHFHGAVPPDQLPSRATEHDIGLALETEIILNRRLAVTNKQFLYMLAGIAIVATDIPGQRSVMEACPDAGVLYSPGDVEAVAACLDRLAREPDRLAMMKHASLEAARTVWNWELESQRLVATVDGILQQRTRLAG